MTTEAIRQPKIDDRQITKQKRLAKRDNLYWNFRYRKDSYKAHKAGFQPILITAKRGGDMIRIYGESGKTIEQKKLTFASLRFKAWGQKERELKKLQMPAYKQWLKKNRLTAKNNPFSYWLINIRESELVRKG